MPTGSYPYPCTLKGIPAYIIGRVVGNGHIRITLRTDLELKDPQAQAAYIALRDAHAVPDQNGAFAPCFFANVPETDISFNGQKG